MAFIILILFPLCFYGGFRLGSHHTRRENDTLRNQLILQEKFSRNWAAEATDKYTLVQHVGQQHYSNVSSTIQMVVHLLQTIQLEQGHNLSSQENEKINQLINQAKQVAIS